MGALTCVKPNGFLAIEAAKAAHTWHIRRKQPVHGRSHTPLRRGKGRTTPGCHALLRDNTRKRAVGNSSLNRTLITLYETSLAGLRPIRHGIVGGMWRRRRRCQFYPRAYFPFFTPTYRHQL